MSRNNGNRAADLAEKFGDRLTKIETIMEMRMKQGDEFLKDWGAFKTKLDTMNLDVIGLRGFVQDVGKIQKDVEDLKIHKDGVERLKSKAMGIGLGVGIPVTGGSGIVWFEKIAKMLGF